MKKVIHSFSNSVTVKQKLTSIFCSVSEDVKEIKEEPEEAKPDLVMPEGQGEDGGEGGGEDRKRKVPSPSAASASTSDASRPPPSSLNRSGSVDLPLPSTSSTTASSATVKQASVLSLDHQLYNMLSCLHTFISNIIRLFHRVNC